MEMREEKEGWVEPHKVALCYGEWGVGSYEDGRPFFSEELLILQFIKYLLYFAPNLSLQCYPHLNFNKEEENEQLARGPGVGVWEEHVALKFIVH